MFTRTELNRIEIMDSFPNIHGLDFRQTPKATTPTRSVTPVINEGEAMGGYINETPRSNESGVPDDFQLSSTHNGMGSPKVPEEVPSTLPKVSSFKSGAEAPIFIPSPSVALAIELSEAANALAAAGSTTTVDSTDCAIPTQYAHPKRSLKKLQKCKKEKDREIGTLVKQWNNQSIEEKFNNLVEKYTELYEDNRKIAMKLYVTEKDFAIVSKDQLHWQAEQNKLVMQRTRLEGVCRELQKQNKQIKEESSQRIREEEERRKEVTTKFQATLNEVSAIMAQNTEKNTKLRDDNIDITNKFKSLCEQFEKREDQMVRMGKQMDLEKQLADAHIKKVEFELKAERELWSKERDIANQNVRNAEEQIDSLQKHIVGLEAHLRIYTDKYTEFETTINKSNEVFDNYKREMGDLNKQMVKVDKDAKQWKARWEKNSHAMVELSETNQLQDIILKKNEKKIEKLQGLCRTLHSERAAYLALLRSHGIDPHITSIVVEDADSKAEAQSLKSKKEQELDLLQREMSFLKKKLKEEEVKMKQQTESFDSQSAASSPEPKSETPTKRRHRRRKNKNSNDDETNNKDFFDPKTEMISAEAMCNTNEIVLSELIPNPEFALEEDSVPSNSYKGNKRRNSLKIEKAAPLKKENDLKHIVFTDIIRNVDGKYTVGKHTVVEVNKNGEDKETYSTLAVDKSFANIKTVLAGKNKKQKSNLDIQVIENMMAPFEPRDFVVLDTPKSKIDSLGLAAITESDKPEYAAPPVFKVPKSKKGKGMKENKPKTSANGGGVAQRVKSSAVKKQ